MVLIGAKALIADMVIIHILLALKGEFTMIEDISKEENNPYLPRNSNQRPPNVETPKK